jgi:hypothetical protein
VECAARPAARRPHEPILTHERSITRARSFPSAISPRLTHDPAQDCREVASRSRYSRQNQGYGDWRSLELAIKDAAKKAARQAGPGISAASVDAQIRQAPVPGA